MTEKLHKIVNGVRIDLTEEEELDIRASWKFGEERQSLRLQQMQEKIALQEQTKNKLISIGLSEQEVNLIKFK